MCSLVGAWMFPASGMRAPVMELMMVVFPDALVPARPRTYPRGMSRSRSWSVKVPRRLRSPRIRTTVSGLLGVAVVMVVPRVGWGRGWRGALRGRCVCRWGLGLWYGRCGWRG